MPPRVMVVDDDPDHLRVVSTILEEMGYEVEEAEDAEAALARDRKSTRLNSSHYS